MIVDRPATYTSPEAFWSSNYELLHIFRVYNRHNTVAFILALDEAECRFIALIKDFVKLPENLTVENYSRIYDIFKDKPRDKLGKNLFEQHNSKRRAFITVNVGSPALVVR